MKEKGDIEEEENVDVKLDWKGGIAILQKISTISSHKYFQR